MPVQPDFVALTRSFLQRLTGSEMKDLPCIAKHLVVQRAANLIRLIPFATPWTMMTWLNHFPRTFQCELVMNLKLTST